MRITLSFSLPGNPELAEKTYGKLADVIQLINEDKEEQAIEPAFFIGNLPDYPGWLREAFDQPALRAAVEACGELEPGEMADWDLESWYEDLLAGETWDFKLLPVEEGKSVLQYEADEEPYGGDLPLMWVLLAAGVKEIRRGVDLNYKS